MRHSLYVLDYDGAKTELPLPPILVRSDEQPNITSISADDYLVEINEKSFSNTLLAIWTVN